MQGMAEAGDFVRGSPQTGGAPAAGEVAAERPRLAVGPDHRKSVVAGINLLPLPGSPAYDRQGGMRPIVARARQDAAILADFDIDALLFANEADTPFLHSLGPDTVSAFTEAVAEATRDLRIPVGINALLDPVAAISIAHATGGSFVRGYFSGAYATESGFMDTHGAAALRVRAYLGASSVQVLHNLVCVFGAHIAPRPIDQEALGALVHGRVDGYVISGGIGVAAPIERFREVRQAVPDLPILAGTGVDVQNVREIFNVADGAIVVTKLRKDGLPMNPPDPERVAAFVRQARGM